ncbi:MAG: 4-hydroxythreonine-4-phosphate dehydrogenase PdxA [Deltaproteobacteria bacterium]|nr:4-hydroxythreonine-4-phosphate dehydrogenase PdxA [Deltaproteobacteria bacterium]
MSYRKKGWKPRIAITMGDPRGIGPEVVAKAFARVHLSKVCTPLVLGDRHILDRAIKSMRLGLEIVEVGEQSQEVWPGVLPVFSLSNLPARRLPEEIPPEESSRASFAYVERAAKMALDGKVEAIVTAPVSKEAIHGAGIPFQGHTEYLAEISGTKKFVMMLVGKRLKVALVTTHIPLGAVPKYLQEEKILSVIEVTSQGLLDYFQKSAPSIAVAALNPHAGEGGLFGKEERIISQAVQRVREKGISVSGPWPADSLFPRAQRGEFDVVVCMYHDQGLIPLKLLHFDTAVNVTLGLPFIRTSVDHGVAYDIAGRGVASSRSLEEAIRLAARMARTKEKNKSLSGRRFTLLDSKHLTG